jgi:hypothetical protein
MYTAINTNLKNERAAKRKMETEPVWTNEKGEHITKENAIEFMDMTKSIIQENVINSLTQIMMDFCPPASLDYSSMST